MLRLDLLWPAFDVTVSAVSANQRGTYKRKGQTFEGGISAQPDAEAHGAYAFCALGCLSILASPDVSIPRYVTSWRPPETRLSPPTPSSSLLSFPPPFSPPSSQQLTRSPACMKLTTIFPAVAISV